MSAPDGIDWATFNPAQGVYDWAPAERAKQKAKRRAPVAAPPPPPRYEGGTWRPNAPGFPPVPNTTPHLRRTEEK